MLRLSGRAHGLLQQLEEGQGVPVSISREVMARGKAGGLGRGQLMHGF